MSSPGIRRSLLVGLLLVVLSGCAPVDLRPGQAVVQRKCGACHKLPSDEALRAQTYEAHAERHGGRWRLTDAERDELETECAPAASAP